MTQKRYLRRDEVPAYLMNEFSLPVSVSTLEKMAVSGKGPAFHKAGKWTVYGRDDLDRWALDKLGRAVRSTAEYAPAQASA